MSRLPALFICSAFALGLSGCGTFGGIAKVPAKFPDLAATELHHTPTVRAVTMDPDAATNQAVGAYNVGRFDSDELEILRQSLIESLAPARVASAAPPVDVHVHVHRYILSFSNIEGGALAVVDWCAVRDGRIVVDELFYVSFYAHNFPIPKETLGSTKNRINRALVRHVAERALSACGYSSPHTTDPNVHDSAEKATAVFPESLTSYYVGPLFGFIGAKTQVKGLNEETKLNWSQRLNVPPLENGASAP